MQFVGTTREQAHGLLLRMWHTIGGTGDLGKPVIVTIDSVVVEVHGRVGLVTLNGSRVQRMLPLRGDEIEITDFDGGREVRRRILRIADADAE
jgi:hypothetical protein